MLTRLIPLLQLNFQYHKQSSVTLQIFDALGREITILVNETKQAGSYEITWNGENNPRVFIFTGLVRVIFQSKRKWC